MWEQLLALALLHSMEFPADISDGTATFSGFVAENYGGKSSYNKADNEVHVTGNNKLYLVEDFFNLMDWPLVSYQKLHLLGKVLSFTVDLSSIGCNCNAAV